MFVALPAVTVFLLHPSTQVASLPTIQILFNSVVSDNTFFGSIALSDFYLGTSLDPPKFIKLFTHQFSSQVLARLNLLLFIQTTPPPAPSHPNRPPQPYPP